MGFTRPWGPRALALVVAPVISFSVLTTAQSATASATDPTPVSGQALPTVQANGVVWAQQVSGGRVFAGGSFSEAQPAGAAAGVNVVGRSNVLSYNVETGVLDPGFAPVVNGQVRGITTSPDGSRVYITGNFTTVNGQPHDHIAALDATTGVPVAGFTASLNGVGYTVLAAGATVYVGGSFTAADSVSRPRAAAFTAGSGALTNWSPAVADNTVRAMVMSPDGRKIVLGGSFTGVNGSSSPGKAMAAVDSTSGASLPWRISPDIYNSGPDSAITSLSSNSTAVYATGYVFGGPANGNLEGAVALHWSDGSLIWIEDCHGDSYGSAPFNDAVYVVSHSHSCADIGGWTETEPKTFHRAIAFSQAATGTVARNTEEGPYVSFAGNPAPSLIDWYPTLTVGTYTGLSQAAWSVAAGGSYVVLGGEFTKVNGVRQTGLVRFKGSPEAAAAPLPAPAPPTPTPTSTPTTPTTDPTQPSAPGSVVAPSAARSVSALALGPSAIAVKWKVPASKAKPTSYLVRAMRGSRTISSVTVSVAHTRAVLGHLKRSTAYRVTVVARNAGGNAKAASTRVMHTAKRGKNVSSTKTPTKPRVPAAVAKGAHSIRVNWKAVSVSGATSVSGFQLRIYKAGKLVKTVAASRQARTLTIKGLAAATVYRVSVRASNWAGYGTTSGQRRVRTRS